MRIIILLLLLTSFLCHSQELKLSPDGSINQEANMVAADNFGNIFLLNKNKITKYNKNLELQYSYTSAKAISSIDVSDPMKIIVFHKDLGIINILDNSLSESGAQIKLFELGLDKASLACTSHRNGVYIYDPFTARLSHIDFDNNITTQSQNINLNFDNEFNPDFIAERKNIVFLSDSSKGMMIFDKYCTYKSFFLIQSSLALCIESDKIMFYKDNAIYQTDFDLAEPVKYISLPDSNIKSFYFINNKLYILTNNQLKIYKAD